MSNNRIDLRQDRISTINNLINEFPVSIEEISKLERHDLGELHLLDYQEYYVFFANVIKKLSTIELTNIPLITLTEIKNLLQNFQSLYNDILNYQVHSFRQEDKTSLGKTLSGFYRKVIDYIVPIITYYSMLDDDILNKKNTLIQLNTYYGNVLNNANNDLKTKIEEFDKVIQESKEAIAKENVHKHAHIFNSESVLHKNSARNSLILLSVIIIIIVSFSLFSLFLWIPEIKIEESMKIIQFSITKIVILTTLFYALSLALKNYKAHKHNEIVNKHRQNSLLTFQTFSMAADNDPAIKNAILLEATRTIFSAQQSGYLNNEGDSENPNRIIEIIKNVTKN